jgi:adenosylcobinamide-GDP ribazoletransferase
VSDRLQDAPGQVSGVSVEIRLAAGFLTIFPIFLRARATDDAHARSFAWFPLVGLMIGALLWLEDAALAWIFGHALRSVIVVLTLTVITGAVHLDGLADTADALGAGRDRARALEILRDSRVGSYGAAALFFALALKTLSLAALGGARRSAALIAAPVLARWAMVAVSAGVDYLRSNGAGTTLLSGAARRNLVLASALAALSVAPFASSTLLGACGVALVLVVSLRWLNRRWLGGVTGDLIGACGEIVEVAVLITFAA